MNILKDFLNHQLTFRYADVLWLKSHLTWRNAVLTAEIVFGFLGTVVALQLVYPSSWSLPNTQIAGQNYGLRSEGSIARSLEAIESKDIAVQTETQIVNPALSDLGIQLKSKQMAEQATRYSIKQRLTPFSWFTTRHDSVSLDFIIDEATATRYIEGLAKTNTLPVDAAVTIKDGAVVVTPAKAGFAYEPQNARSMFASILLTKKFAISLKPQTLQPAIGTSAAEGAASVVAAQLNELAVTAADISITASKETVASWITLTPNQSAGTIEVGYDRTKIQEFLKTFSNKLYIAETANTVTLLDGEQLAATSGKTGQILGLGASTDRIIESLKQGSKTATAEVQAVSPSTQFIRQYTRSSKGLQALIDYWVKSHGGNYGVTLQRVDGSLAAGYNQNTQFTTASVYKLYIAYGAYHKIEAGELTVDTITSAGKTVAACIEVMIVVSDNTCAIALGNMMGWPTVNSWLKPLGLTGTDISRGGGLLTTSKDVSVFLQQLHAGTLMNAEHTATLLGHMKTQIYRSGIPAGVSGTLVADKVGFLPGINNDAAIVYDPRGTYVLVVMTENSSFADIKDLTAQLNAILQQ